MIKSANPTLTPDLPAGVVSTKTGLIEAFGRFVRSTKATQLHRCVHRMMHEYIVNDTSPDDEYIRAMVYQMGNFSNCSSRFRIVR